MTVHNGRPGLGLSAHSDSDPLPQMGMNVFPQALFLPLAKVVVYSLPIRKIVGKGSPLATGSQDIEDGIDDFPNRNKVCLLVSVVE